MKKLIVAAIAVVVGFAANAASIDWKVTVTSPTDGAYGTGYNAYVFTADAWADILAEGITSTAFSDYSDKSELIANGSSGKGAAKVYKFDTTDGTTVGLTRTVTGFAGATANLVAVIANDEGYAAFDFIAAVRDDMSPVTEPAKLTYTDAQVTSAWTAVENVPEPTSGMLILLGMAGLALRRKQK